VEGLRGRLGSLAELQALPPAAQLLIASSCYVHATSKARCLQLEIGCRSGVLFAAALA
jgi:hypothetical protein